MVAISKPYLQEIIPGMLMIAALEQTSFQSFRNRQQMWILTKMVIPYLREPAAEKSLGLPLKSEVRIG